MLPSAPRLLLTLSLLAMIPVLPGAAPAASPRAGLPADSAAAASGKVRPVIVDQGRIRVPGHRGGFVPDARLVGARLVGFDDAGRPVEFRIDSILPPEEGPRSLTRYVYSSRDADGAWGNACAPDAQGRRFGFALPGRLDAGGRYVADSAAFSITCSSGAAGKCLLSGYLPWGTAKDGRSLAPWFQACTRLVRADYCGNGASHTRDGTRIELWDHLGIEKDTRAPGLVFEASWDAHGAVWLQRTRLPEVASLEDIARECPEKFARMRRPSDTTARGPALMLNRSR